MRKSQSVRLSYGRNSHGSIVRGLFAALSAFLVGAIFAGAATAQTSPQNGTVVGGLGSIQQTGANLQRPSSRIPTVWRSTGQSFSVGPNGVVRFVQANSASVGAQPRRRRRSVADHGSRAGQRPGRRGQPERHPVRRGFSRRRQRSDRDDQQHPQFRIHGRASAISTKASPIPGRAGRRSRHHHGRQRRQRRAVGCRRVERRHDRRDGGHGRARGTKTFTVSPHDGLLEFRADRPGRAGVPGRRQRARRQQRHDPSRRRPRDPVGPRREKRARQRHQQRRHRPGARDPPGRRRDRVRRRRQRSRQRRGHGRCDRPQCGRARRQGFASPGIRCW